VAALWRPVRSADLDVLQHAGPCSPSEAELLKCADVVDEHEDARPISPPGPAKARDGLDLRSPALADDQSSGEVVRDPVEHALDLGRQEVQHEAVPGRQLPCMIHDQI
jgi:hypothetical protein